MDRRTTARQIAMQGLYQLDIKADLEMVKKFITAASDDDLVCSLAEEWTLKTWQNKPSIDEMITKAAIKWQMSRLSPVDKSILRLSAYQIKFCPEIPDKVVINEAIEMAKKYSSQQAPGFVNGVLDAVMKSSKE